MATADEVYKQIQGNQALLDEYLNSAGTASGLFTDAVQKAYKNNEGAIKNAAALEGMAYAMPGKLMDQYNAEFGGKTSVGSMDRINSLLKNLGQSFSRSNAAWGVVDQAKTRQSDLIKAMNERFQTEMAARQQKHNDLYGLWQTLYNQEQANKRARSTSSYAAPNYKKLEELLNKKDNNTTTTTTTQGNPKPLTGFMGMSPKDLAQSSFGLGSGGNLGLTPRGTGLSGLNSGPRNVITGRGIVY